MKNKMRLTSQKISFSNFIRLCTNFIEKHEEKVTNQNTIDFEKQLSFWKNIDHQKEFLESIALKFKIIHWEGWYRIPQKTVVENGGKTFLKHFYGNSLMKALLHIYPQYPWNIHLFGKLPRNHWNDILNQRKFFDSVGNKLGVKSYSDWYNIRNEDIKMQGGAGLLKHYKDSLSEALPLIYPEFNWELNKKLFVQPFISKAQMRLYNIVMELFPDSQVQMEGNHSRSKYNRPVQFDIFIPSLHLAIEYQGEQHFEDSLKFGGSSEQHNRDVNKKELCEKNGITLIEIPYWWNGTKESIQATIHHFRNDLLSPLACLPIPSTPPKPHRIRKLETNSYQFKFEK